MEQARLTKTLATQNFWKFCCKLIDRKRRQYVLVGQARDRQSKINQKTS
ncbi:MAG: hypothetical protein S4CHLAM81_10520 [Chlamydiales bacterium]|nr:hypothetical protein [Chlamydiales bacterium]MCH9635830.1 hypothetical protein [Chlamydiales bacterium]